MFSKFGFSLSIPFGIFENKIFCRFSVLVSVMFQVAFGFCFVSLLVRRSIRFQLQFDFDSISVNKIRFIFGFGFWFGFGLTSAYISASIIVLVRHRFRNCFVSQRVAGATFLNCVANFSTGLPGLKRDHRSRRNQ